MTVIPTSTASKSAMREAVGILRAGGVVALPTDTLYGLGADAFSVDAVLRVFQVKGRPTSMAIPLLLGNVRDIETVAVEVPDLAWDLVKRFWPGPLTLVLRKSPDVPDVVTGSKDSIAVRMPDHSVPLSLINELGGPITGTSANPTAGPDPTTAQDVATLLDGEIDLIIDGGPAPLGSPSTVLELTGPTPRILREGAIPLPRLQSHCPVPIEPAREHSR